MANELGRLLMPFMPFEWSQTLFCHVCDWLQLAGLLASPNNPDPDHDPSHTFIPLSLGTLRPLTALPSGNLLKLLLLLFSSLASHLFFKLASCPAMMPIALLGQ